LTRFEPLPKSRRSKTLLLGREAGC